MALSQALSIGISGLMTHQKAMDNIGNNLANVNTFGFKKGVFQFSTLLEQSLRGGMSADASSGRGSVNPVSIGLGTSIGSIKKVFTQGGLETTGNPYDMAIDGNGFFVLRQGNGYVYTRAGSFSKGEDGGLMANNGLYVQGTMATRNYDGSYSIPQDTKLQNIIIPLGATGGHSQTSKTAITGNLDSTQEVSAGTRLFGGVTYPNVSSLQKWMNPDFNGGDPLENSKVDTSWNALEDKTYAVSASTIAAFAPGTVLSNSKVTLYADKSVVNFKATNVDSVVYAAMDSATGAITDYPNGIKIGALIATPPASGGKYIPLIEEVKTVNGGNVQTSAAYAIETPEYLQMGSTVDGVTIKNSSTLPKWFYESTGGSFAAMANLTDAQIQTDPTGSMKSVWPNGFNGVSGSWPASFPRKGETFPATLNTPLENLRYQKGETWVQPFANIKNGGEISVNFTKGGSKIEATFVYNRPSGAAPFNGQQSLHQEQSYTLEHFLKFLAGDVDEPTVACQRITPAMFGAPIEPDFPDGNYNASGWDRSGYEKALSNVSLATQSGNYDSIGGAMGLISIPPRISDQNYGQDLYDAPAESAGAYTRSGVQTISYKRWNTLLNDFEEAKEPSFNISLLSNLGADNALSDIRITYNNVPHESMYQAESQYAAPQGGSATITLDLYDSLGNPKEATLRLALVSKDDNFTTWRWIADSIDDSDFAWQTNENGEINSSLSIGTGLIRFDKNGNYVKGAEFSETNGLTINLGKQGVNTPIIVQIMNGLSSTSLQDFDFHDLTCTATANDVKLASQNGAPPGTLDDFVVGLNGVIQGKYSNGNIIPIARIALANFANEHGLIPVGNDLFYAGPGSGDPLYSHAGQGGTGNICYKQLEMSNVELSEEFTKLISTERGYQANSRTITTADEMIQELLNLKR